MSQFAQAHTWLDYVTVFSTALAAIGTLMAVVLALYLNVWRERRARPQLSFEDFEDTWFGVGFNPGESVKDSVWGIPLLVRNAQGRNTAHEVQVLLTFGTKAVGDSDWTDLVLDQPLVWRFAALPSPGGGTMAVDIPPGVARKVFVAFIGEPNQLYKTLWPHEGMVGGFANEAGEQIKYDKGGRAVPASPPIAGVLATYPFTQDDPFWFWRDQEYRFLFTITSHDSDAVSYETIIKFTHSEHTGKTADIRGRSFIQPEWSDLKRI